MLQCYFGDLLILVYIEVRMLNLMRLVIAKRESAIGKVARKSTGSKHRSALQSSVRLFH